MPASTLNFDLPRPTAHRRISAIVMVFLALGLFVVGPGTASAHTGFESSTPTDGAAIDRPVELVTIVFTGEANPVGDKFVALTAEGLLQEPTSVETIDNKLFSIRFDPPLVGGQVGLRWNVQAADAHPIEGAFSFTVNAPAPTTAPPTTIPPTTVQPAAVEPATTNAPAVLEDEVPVEADAAASAAVVVIEEAAPPPADQTVSETADSAATSTQSLDEFLAVDNTTPGETTLTVGHLIGFLGVALGLGTLAFVATALRGRRDEVRHALTAVRIFGLVIAIGAAIEYVGVTRMGGQSLFSSFTTAPAFAASLRILGGIGLAVGLAGTVTRARVQRVIRQPSKIQSLSAAVAEDLAPGRARHAGDAPIVRWTPNEHSWPALGGAVLVLVSFWFDGHTVSKGFRPLHALVNSVHVAAGSVWVGGVVAMAAIIWTRYRSHEPMRVVELVVRFSKIATVALAAVVAAGGIMAFLVLDTFGELTGTPWGQILLLKTAAVGLAMLGGAYNHFRLLPALESDPESPELVAALRNTITAEAIMLVFVVTVTAWLVAAAS